MRMRRWVAHNLKLSRLGGLAALMIVGSVPAVLVAASPAQAAGTSVNVFVGYGDNLRPGVNFPVPWQGAPNTTFIGSGPSFDAGAIRLDNPNLTPITVDGVSVDLQRPGPTFNLWGSFTIAAGKTVILTQTSQYNFDTSDFQIEPCGVVAPPGDPRIPKVTITVGGVATSFLDTAHTLDTFGYDSACGGNESLQWRPIGGVSCPTCGAKLSLAPASQSGFVGSTQTVVASLVDAGGAPLSNVTVDFKILSGPNAGRTGSAVTGPSGTAPFPYSSSLPGTDTLQASVTNASGASFSSNTVTVTWVSPRKTGDAYPARVTAPVVGTQTVAEAGPVDTTTASNTSNSVATLPGPVVSGTALGAGVVTGVSPDQSSAQASAASLTVAATGLPVIKATVAQASSQTSCAGSSGTANIASLSVDGVVAASGYYAPNSTVTVPTVAGPVTVVLNQQTPVPGGLRVNAAHVSGPSGLDVVIASATSDIHNCP